MNTPATMADHEADCRITARFEADDMNITEDPIATNATEEQWDEWEAHREFVVATALDNGDIKCRCGAA